MKTLHKTLITLALGSALTGGAVYAATGQAQPGTDGVAVTETLVIEQMPTEVKSGSIQLGDQSESSATDQARLSAADAMRIAQTAYPAKVVEAGLENENGFLVWNITQVGKDGKEVTLMIDAGNGTLLAAETGDDEHTDSDSEHADWKFWQERDDHEDERG